VTNWWYPPPPPAPLGQQEFPLADILGLRADVDEAFARLYDRFSVEAGAPDLRKASLLVPTIQPITSMDTLLVDHKGILEITAYSSAGVMAVATVPVGERWTVNRFRIARSGGDGTFVELFTTDTSEGVTVDLDSFGATNIKLMRLEQPLVLEERDTLDINIDAVTSGGNWRCHLWVAVEKAF